MYDASIQKYIAQKGRDVIVDIVTKGVADRIIKVHISEPIVMLASITAVAKEMGIETSIWHMLLDTGIVYARIKG